MSLVIVDYGIGNIGSIINMFKRIGYEVILSSDPEVIYQADKLLLPGVGAFDQGMSSLRESGLVATLEKSVFEKKTPILGICLGMQLFFESSEEGKQPGLAWIPGHVKKFSVSEKEKLRIPHMGWNIVNPTQSQSLFKGIYEETRFYFVHSYYVTCKNEEHILGTTPYGSQFVSCVQKDNIYGVQFHPEKSHKFGLQLLKNFVEL